MVSEMPEEEEDLYENGLRDRCFICLDPCEDADMPTARLSREENCHRCHPCWLCTECRIRMSNGKWCCFDCLENDDLESVSNATNASIRRLNLVRPRWCEENSIMPASILCWHRKEYKSSCIVKLWMWPSRRICVIIVLSLIHIWRCRRSTLCRSRWSPYH